MIRNPILPGFNPDPSICRVGNDFYIATSTFEWYPGVQIHHSHDLANWRLVARPLNRAALLDMRGTPDSGGIWAPCLSHADGRFWLVYTHVRRLDGAFKDAHNYITACETIDGEWCDPWYVNSSGFDPSLFHDADGRKWFLNQRWNHRGRGTGGNPTHDSFDGIILQEWSPEGGLSGAVSMIYPGSEIGLTEAPHLFRRGGYYYLTVAEGGTGYGHAVTLARARDIRGPYETRPQGPLFTSRDAPDHPIQRVGHGQMVEAPDGTVLHSFLMGRPIPGPDGTGRFCPLGRETGLEACVWGDDGWLHPATGSPLVRSELPQGGAPVATGPIRRRFDTGTLPPEFQWLRSPFPERLFRLERDALVLIGRESIGSWWEQALVARRQEHHAYTAETEVTIAPPTYQQGAGLATYYNRHKFHAAVVSHEPGIGRALCILSCPGDWPDARMMRAGAPLALPADGPVALRVEVDRHRQQFLFRTGGDWQPVGPELDATTISDEAGRGEHGSFTGAFVGMIAYDLAGTATEAEYSHFDYLPRGE